MVQMLLIIFAFIAQCVTAVPRGETVVELTAFCANTTTSPRDDRLPLLPRGMAAELPEFQIDLSTAKENICNKASAGKSVTLQQFVTLINNGEQYLSFNNHFSAMVVKYSQQDSDPFKILLKIVETVANLESDIMGKLLLESYNNDFLLADEIKNLLPQEIKVDETTFSSQNYANGKYDLPLFGYTLLSTAKDKVKRFRTFVETQEKRVLKQMKDNQGSYDRIMQALLEDIFGNLPWQERLERLKLGYSLYQLLASGGKSSREGRYLRRGFSKSLSTAESRVNFFGAYLLGSSYPNPVIRTKVPVGASDKLLFIDSLGVHLEDVRMPRYHSGVLNPFPEFTEMFELNREVANDAKKMDTLASLRSKTFPYVTPGTTLGGIFSSGLIGGVVYLSTRLVENAMRLAKPKASSYYWDRFDKDLNERYAAEVNVILLAVFTPAALMVAVAAIGVWVGALFSLRDSCVATISQRMVAKRRELEGNPREMV